MALRYGINTIDTSPYYTTSEAVLGKAFAAIADEFPRNSYQIITKVGRYGRTREDGFDYSPEKIRSSIENSLKLLGTDYLDGVYMHDVEFVVDQLADAGEEGFKVDREDGHVREEDFKKWGLEKGDEGVIRSEGDRKVLEAMRTLFQLKKEGLIRVVGFTGSSLSPRVPCKSSFPNLPPRPTTAFPLPTLIRIARLVSFHLEPIDIIQTYCHHTLQNTTLSSYLPLFAAAGVKQVISASPLCMGVLRNADAQPWHPASPELKSASRKAVAELANRGTTLEKVSLGYGLTSAAVLPGSGRDTPTVLGFSNPEEVHEAMEVYQSLYDATPESRKGRIPGEGLGESKAHQEQMECEKIVVNCFKENGTFNQTWSQGV